MYEATINRTQHTTEVQARPAGAVHHHLTTDRAVVVTARQDLQAASVQVALIHTLQVVHQVDLPADHQVVLPVVVVAPVQEVVQEDVRQGYFIESIITIK